MDFETPDELAPALGGEAGPSEWAPVLGGPGAPPPPSYKPGRDVSQLGGLAMYFAKAKGNGYQPNLGGHAMQDYVEKLLEEE